MNNSGPLSITRLPRPTQDFSIQQADGVLSIKIKTKILAGIFVAIGPLSAAISIAAQRIIPAKDDTQTVQRVTKLEEGQAQLKAGQESTNQKLDILLKMKGSN